MGVYGLPGLPDDYETRLRAILRHPEFHEGGYRERGTTKCNCSWEAHPFHFASWAVIERNNLRLRLDKNRKGLSLHVKVTRTHRGRFLTRKKSTWVDITDEAASHPAWPLVCRTITELEQELKTTVDPPPPQPDAGAGQLSIVTKSS